MKPTNILMACAILCTGTILAEARPDLVAKVARGELKEARASWWGFDKADATKFLQAAIDSRVPRLVIDRMEEPWSVLPLNGVSNQELFFEKGAVVQAKRGEYKSKGACLFSFRACENVKLSGYGATIRMWHEDYMNPPYEKSEWRHALSILSSRNVLVEGLTIASSGGDGIYIGSSERKLRKCVDVVIRDVLCHDNHRQGISIITAENLLIENTVMRETHGTPPAAGIDFEPNHPEECLKNCVMRNCLTVNNEGAGYTTWAGQLNSGSAPIDIRFENCTSLGDRISFNCAVDSRKGRDVGGHVTITNCSFEKPRGPGAVRLNGNRFGTLTYDVAASRIVQTNAVGAEVVTQMDDAWCKANLPLQFDPDFSIPHVANPDLAHAEIRDAAPGAPVKLQPMRIRNRGTYIVYANAARTLRFSGHQCRVGRYAPSTKPILVTTLDGRQVAKIPLPDFDKADFSFDAPAAGFYLIQCDLAAVAFTLTSADAPVALNITDGSQNLIASAGAMWFFVPANTPKLAFFVSGECVERVRAKLNDPAGAVAWDQDNISNWNKCVRDKPAAGFWKITLARPSEGCFEDSRYDLAGVPGFLFLSEEKTWLCR